MKLQVIDTHAGGEPTRVVVEGALLPAVQAALEDRRQVVRL